MKGFLALFPVVVILLSEIIRFSSDLLAQLMLMGSIFYMFIFMLHKLNYSYLVLIFILIPFFFLHFLISFNYLAASESTIRYFFPIIILFYSYSIREYFHVLFKFLLFYSVLSFFYQLVIYYNFFDGVSSQWFYKELAKGAFGVNKQFGLIRATGLLGFFDAYGFLNFTMFFLVHYFYLGKRKYSLQLLFLLALFLSISFKLIFLFLFICLFFKAYRLKVMLFLSISVIAVFFFTSDMSMQVLEKIETKVSAYVTDGNSARAESYRVLFKEMKSGSIIGEGIGSFGGAASTKYNSPYYNKVNFNWYRTKNLTTTDTYFPHLFIELGIMTGCLYLLAILFPLFRIRHNKLSLKIILILYTMLFFDSIFSFALNNMAYLLFSLLLVYPIMYYVSSQKMRNELK